MCYYILYLGKGKLAIWLSRKIKLLGSGLTDVILVFRGLITSHINIEYAYYLLIDDLDTFRSKWSTNRCICEIEEDGCLKVSV